MDCRYLEDLYELFVLGALGDREASSIWEHLRRDCPECHKRLHQAALTIAALLLTAKPVPSTAKQKARFIEQLKSAGVAKGTKK